MTMSQPTAGIQGMIAGLNGVPTKDTTAWRTKYGFSGDASSLWVIRFLRGFLFMGSGTPAHDAVTRYDWAINTNTGIIYSTVDISAWSASHDL